MRPTFSIIVFTVLSGAGYGLLFLLGLGLALGSATPSPYPISLDAASGNAVALVAQIVNPRSALRWPLLAGTLLVSAGLLASVAHLGKPLRAWRAFSQWRSSWLSREGVVSLLTYAPIAAIAGWSFDILPAHHAQSGLRISGGVLAVLCVITVVCTANIYASLKPIRAWHNAYVVPVYGLLALTTGLYWLLALGGMAMPGVMHGPHAHDALVIAACTLALISAMVKLAYWRWLDHLPRAPDAATATGLAGLGKVSSFEAPHTEHNYLTHEMGFVLARKHARRLRVLVIVLGFALPIALLALGAIVTASRLATASIALTLGMLGVFIERWLFFAEARHAVIAYYGR